MSLHLQRIEWKYSPPLAPDDGPLDFAHLSRMTLWDPTLLAAMSYKKYHNQLRACAAVDFDDLFLLTVQLFQDHPMVLQKYQSRYDHVQIDEYQDTNGVQFRLIESLVLPHKNLCVVGDEDQSIYGWRGAEVEHIIHFGNYFPGTKIVRLENNYRCTNDILDCANRGETQSAAA